MHVYFEREGLAAWGFAGGGCAGFVGGAVLFAAHDPFFRGLAYPRVAVGVVQLVVGMTLLARMNGQVADLDARLDRGKRAFLDVEEPRTRGLREKLGWLEAAELVLLASGLGIATYGGFQHDHSISGIGTGIALQGASLFTFSTHAAERTDLYSAALAAFAR
jgi:hypothetical protein